MALPSGRAVNVTTSEFRFAESTSASVPAGAIRTGICSVNATVTSWPAATPFRSTIGASFTAATFTVNVWGTVVALSLLLASVLEAVTERLNVPLKSCAGVMVNPLS